MWRCRDSNPGPNGRTRRTSTCIAGLFMLTHPESQPAGPGMSKGWSDLVAAYSAGIAATSSPKAMPRYRPVSECCMRQMRRSYLSLRRHRVRVIVRSCLFSAVYTSLPRGSARNPLHDTTRRNQNIPKLRKNIAFDGFYNHRKARRFLDLPKNACLGYCVSATRSRSIGVPTTWMPRSFNALVRSGSTCDRRLRFRYGILLRPPVM